MRALFTEMLQVHGADIQHVISVMEAKVLEVEEGMRRINSYTETVDQKVEWLNKKCG